MKEFNTLTVVGDSVSIELITLKNWSARRASNEISTAKYHILYWQKSILLRYQMIVLFTIVPSWSAKGACCNLLNFLLDVAQRC